MIIAALAGLAFILMVILGLRSGQAGTGGNRAGI